MEKEITQNTNAIGTITESELDSIISEDVVMNLVLDAVDEENGIEDVNINCQFDERVQQQGTGDCYLLATLKHNEIDKIITQMSRLQSTVQILKAI